MLRSLILPLPMPPSTVPTPETRNVEPPSYTIVSKPSYSALILTMKAGQEVHAESGALLAASGNPEIKGAMKGGIMGALKRTILTSESFFVTTIKAKQDDTEVYLAPRSVGDVEVLPLDGEDYIVQGGSFLAAESGITTDVHFSGWKGFISGEGIFMIRAVGKGKMFVSSFGGILKRELRAGETFLVDNSHIVAFPASMPYSIQRVGSGITDMVTTGEGLACIFTGPGTIYVQTRNLRTFAEQLNPFLRNRERSKGASGILGQIFGG